LLARLEPVQLPTPTSLYLPHETPKYAHFMTSGIASVVTFMQDGNGVEVGLIGNEGLVEAVHLLGTTKVPTSGFMQVSGSALRMRLEDLRAEFLNCEPLRTVILRCVQGQSLVVTQIAACNRLHEVEERMARWLLMVQDRVGTNEFLLTQEFLAEMIGARRTTVTLAAGSLQRSGLIEYRRGTVRIVDRDGLAEAACECYPIVRKVIAELYL
jgi:CRP-like cAMP-binding protein